MRGLFWDRATITSDRIHAVLEGVLVQRVAHL